MGELRALMIAPTPFFSDRGCHVRMVEEIRALQSMGVRVLLVTYPNGKDVEGIPVVRVGKWTGYGKAEAGPSLAKPFLDILLLFETFNQARKFRPHVIHGHLHEGCLAGWPAAKWRRVPLLFDYQGGLAKELAHHGLFKAEGACYRLFAALEFLIESLPSATLPSSAVLADDIKTPASRIYTLPDSLSPAECEFSEEDKRKIKRRLKLEADKFTVAFMGLFTVYQGVDLLIDAIGELKKRGREEFQFLLMGYPEEARYAEMAKKAGVAEMACFTGRIPYDEAGRYLSVGDAAVAPKIALTESNGKVLNYMACGLPTVAFDTPVNRELMGESGVFVELSGDAGKAAARLADGLEMLADDADLRSRLGAEGKRRVAELFSRESQAERLMGIYRRLLGDRFPGN